MTQMPNSLRICETCPWLIKNHGRKHAAGWYVQSNLRRLWSGLRTGEAPGMICHASDPQSAEYGGKGHIKTGHEHECAGALTLIISNINAIGAGQPQPFQPPMTKPAMARYVERHLFSAAGLPSVEDRRDEIALPWVKDFIAKKADLDARITAHGYTLRYVEYCEDARTPGLLGQMRGVVDHAMKEVKISRKANPSQAAMLDILRHELRHLDEPDWDCGSRDALGRGHHGQPPNQIPTP